MIFKNRILWLGLAVMLTIVMGLQYQLRQPYPDSDQFYHFAISRITAEHGVQKTLPQVEGLGWQQRFPEKEFLFHMLTTAAYRIAEEKGIRFTAILAAATVVGVLFSLSVHYLPAAVAALLSFGLLILDPFFFHRVFLVRPHLLAILLFTLALIGLARRNLLLSAIAGCLYALAYHAVHLPLFVFLCAATTPWLAEFPQAKELRRCALAGVAGLFLGVLLNPYFPWQLEIAWLHLLFVFQGQDPAAPIGAELQPITPWHFAMRSPVLSALVVLLLVACLRDAFSSQRIIRREQTFWAILTACFAAATILNARAMEYLIPLSVLTASCYLRDRSVKRLAVYTAYFAAALAVQSYPVCKAYFDSTTPTVNKGRLSAFRAVQALPEDRSNPLVFNCTFNTGPYLLYLRPDLRFIDLLDPRLYRAAQPERYQLRNRLVHGKLADPYLTLRDTFNAKYVICMRPGLIQQMKSDKRFKRLYPRKPSDPAIVQAFELN